MKAHNSQPRGPLSLRANTIWNMCGSLVYLVCNWLTTVLVVVLSSGYDASGSLTVAMAVGNILSTIVLFRVRPIQVSDIHEQYTAPDYVGLRVASSFAAIVFCLVYSLLTVSPVNMATTFAYMLFKLVDSFVDVFHGVDQQHGRLDYTAISQILRGLFLLAGFIFGLVYLDSLLAAILLMAVTSLAVVFFYDIPKARQFAPLKPRFRKAKLLKLLTICAPGFVSSLVCTMVVSVVRQRFGLIYGDGALGIYAAVAAPTVVVQALVSYLYAPLLGPIAEQWSNGDIRKLRLVLLRVLGVVAAATAACILLAIVAGEWVLNLVYGEATAMYAYLFPLMLVGTACTGLMFFFLDYLIILRDFKGAIISSLASFLASFAFMSMFYQTYDLNSVSLVIVLAYLLGMIVCGTFIEVDFRKRSATA